MSEIIDITAVEAKERFDDGWKPYVIDVRGDMESSAFGQLGFTDLQQEYDEIHEIIDELPRDRDREPVLPTTSTSKFLPTAISVPPAIASAYGVPQHQRAAAARARGSSLGGRAHVSIGVHDDDSLPLGRRTFFPEI